MKCDYWPWCRKLTEIIFTVIKNDDMYKSPTKHIKYTKYKVTKYEIHTCAYHQQNTCTNTNKNTKYKKYKIQNMRFIHVHITSCLSLERRGCKKWRRGRFRPKQNRDKSLAFSNLELVMSFKSNPPCKLKFPSNEKRASSRICYKRTFHQFSLQVNSNCRDIQRYTEIYRDI